MSTKGKELILSKSSQSLVGRSGASVFVANDRGFSLEEAVRNWGWNHLTAAREGQFFRGATRIAFKLTEETLRSQWNARMLMKSISAEWKVELRRINVPLTVRLLSQIIGVAETSLILYYHCCISETLGGFSCTRKMRFNWERDWTNYSTN